MYDLFIELTKNIGYTEKDNTLQALLYDNGYKIHTEVVSREGSMSRYDVPNIVDSIGEMVVEKLIFSSGVLWLETYRLGFGNTKTDPMMYKVLQHNVTGDVYKLICNDVTITFFMSDKSFKKPANFNFIDVVKQSNSVSEMVSNKGVRYLRILNTNLKVFKNGEELRLEEIIYLPDSNEIVIGEDVYPLENTESSGFNYDDAKFTFGEFSIVTNTQGNLEYLYKNFPR